MNTVIKTVSPLHNSKVEQKLRRRMNSKLRKLTEKIAPVYYK